MKRLTCAAILAFVFSAMRSDAQIVTGTIVGTVTDESRAVLPGATATLTSPALPGGPATTVTDEQGRYRFSGLAPGIYALTLTLSGFSTYEEKDLRLITGATIERNPVLKVATVAETITVSGQSPMVDTRTVGVTATTTQVLSFGGPAQTRTDREHHQRAAEHRAEHGLCDLQLLQPDLRGADVMGPAAADVSGHADQLLKRNPVRFAAAETSGRLKESD